MIGLSACGKSITISDSPGNSASSAASAPASSAPPVADAGQPATNTGLQLVDSTAAAAGKTGTGGTVVGTAVQEQPPKWVQLSAVTSPPLSTPHLININQAALYRFDQDTPNSGQSACNDTCATQWPPVTIQQGGAVYVAGVDTKQIGTIKRQDGSIQITVGGMPLYRYSGDSKPGDLNGQGIGGTWFAVTPTGQKATQ
jgi:predicted lipoprotein with Yx(FWY)xxD motif